MLVDSSVHTVHCMCYVVQWTSFRHFNYYILELLILCGIVLLYETQGKCMAAGGTFDHLSV